MTVIDLIHNCKCLGITLKLGEGDKLTIHPANLAPEDLKAELRANKSQVMAVIRLREIYRDMCLSLSAPQVAAGMALPDAAPLLWGELVALDNELVRLRDEGEIGPEEYREKCEQMVRRFL